MASLLRQIVAGPRSRHPEAGLDLCYVTPFIIATSGPSGTYPQRAYRNPLDQLVKFLDYKHQDRWAIWEFRAEGTGYPDEDVYGRVWHYPWPDHHPPPFALVPHIMAGMRNWLLEDVEAENAKGHVKKAAEERKEGDNGRVVVVHCKAGKGRSGTMACSYLISQCGWAPSEALARFTERRMRPGFGQGVSIPSQLRWVGYVDRWTKSGKIYIERHIEVMDVRVWGLRDGVRVQVEGYVDEGKTIKLFHVFTKKERVIAKQKAAGNGNENGGLTAKTADLAGFQNNDKVPVSSTTAQDQSRAKIQEGVQMSASDPTMPSVTPAAIEPGGDVVTFRPSTPIVLPTSDINIDFERRNKARMGYTFVTSVAHVWFNCFFEGHGPEKESCKPDDSGVFEIEWDKMDGIKGSSRKGTRAFDKLAVVWKAHNPVLNQHEPGEEKERVIHEPGPTSPVQRVEAADWKGGNETHTSSTGATGKDLGLRTESPASAEISRASSIRSDTGEENAEFDGASTEGLKTYDGADNEDVDIHSLPQPRTSGVEPKLERLNIGADTASANTLENSTETRSPTMAASSPLDAKSLEEMPTAKEHKLGHISSIKKVVDS